MTDLKIKWDDDIQWDSPVKDAVDTAKVAGTAAIQGAADTADLLYSVGTPMGLMDTARGAANWILRETGLRPNAGKNPGEEYAPVPSKRLESIGVPTDPTKIGVPMTGLRKDIASGFRTATGAATMGAGPIGSLVAGLFSGAGQELGGDAGSLIGSVAGPILVGRVLNRTGRAANPPPTRDELNRTAAAAYDEAARAGVVFNPNATQNLIIGMADDMGRQGLRLNSTASTNIYPGAANSIRLVGDELALGPLTLERAEILRRNLSAARTSANNTGNYDDARLISRLQTRLDRFVGAAGPSDVIAGDPVRGAQALLTARDAYSRSSKAETIEGLIERAILGRSKFTASGLENSLRTEFRNFARREREMRYFSPDEQDAIRRVAEGSLTSNILRGVGRFAVRGPVSGGLGLGVAAAADPLAGAALWGAGELGRAGATAMTRGAARDALDTTLRGYRYTQPLNAVEQQLIRAAMSAAGLEAAQ